MIDKPKPCPVCGDDDSEVYQEWDGSWRVVCLVCGNESAGYDTILEAVDLWNREGK